MQLSKHQKATSHPPQPNHNLHQLPLTRITTTQETHLLLEEWAEWEALEEWED